MMSAMFRLLPPQQMQIVRYTGCRPADSSISDRTIGCPTRKKATANAPIDYGILCDIYVEGHHTCLLYHLSPLSTSKSSSLIPFLSSRIFYRSPRDFGIKAVKFPFSTSPGYQKMPSLKLLRYCPVVFL